MANTYTLTAKATIDLVDNNNNVLADIIIHMYFLQLHQKQFKEVI